MKRFYFTTEKCKTCTRNASYNYKNIKKPEYCGDHKLDQMVLSKKRYCVEENCFNLAIYKTSETSFTSHCEQHKNDTMILEDNLKPNHIIKSPRCEIKICSNISLYGLSESKRPTVCLYHKNTVPKYRFSKDIKYFTMNICEDCDEKAKFNHLNDHLQGGIKCHEHKLDQMINVYDDLCTFGNCIKKSFYGFEGRFENYCFQHVQNGMKVNIEGVCLRVGCEQKIAKSGYDGYCSHCFTITNPNGVKETKLTKTKEISVCIKILEQLGNNYNVFFNKTLNNKKRPDVIVSNKNENELENPKTIIIEIDEKQHKEYTDNEELSRIQEFKQQYNNLFVIRFNPDGYKNIHKTRINSCFEKNIGSKCAIKESEKKQFDKRIQTLINTIQNIYNNTINERIIYLFYDGFDDTENNQLNNTKINENISNTNSILENR